MTAWSKLLVATTRLIDLHDSAHEPGSPFVQVSQEQRRGLRDGYWLDLGCLLLDYLLDVDFATNSAFVSQTRCLDHLRDTYPGMPHDDLTFVINLLSTPSELHVRQPFPDPGAGEALAPGGDGGLRSRRSTKRTALIEKQGQTGQVRLTPSGRQAVTLASQVEDLLYSEYDAAKVLAALARGDFARIPDITNQILLAIRALTQELRRVRENPTREGKLSALLDNERHYHNALSSIQQTLLDARTQLTTPKLMERFDGWCEKHAEEWDLRVLSSAIGRVLTAIENLSRRLSELLADIAEGRIQSMGVIDFQDLARELLTAPSAPRLQGAMVKRMMPLHTQAVFPRPAPLVPLLESRRAETSHVALVFDEQQDAAPEDPLLARFLEARGPALRERIQAAPLSLPEALEEGWHRFEEGDCLAQLLNTFVDTELLDRRLTVGIEGRPFELLLADGRRIDGAVTPSLGYFQAPLSMAPEAALGTPLSMAPEAAPTLPPNAPGDEHSATTRIDQDEPV
ncbi:hypothetical protein [Billgrantia endophytica]|uniref:Uncharacterized protein n=1 Tax=Billgrantia endophytica TaxID=2033802 RepID=A0A2N7TWP6_9GAMM|nr:hypothetical protein [Halomonas endophytica]PMR72613.1 hypothetical protein C1H69_20420 [Halomonas endophytica]